MFILMLLGSTDVSKNSAHSLFLSVFGGILSCSVRVVLKSPTIIFFSVLLFDTNAFGIPLSFLWVDLFVIV